MIFHIKNDFSDLGMIFQRPQPNPSPRPQGPGPRPQASGPRANASEYIIRRSENNYWHEISSRKWFFWPRYDIFRGASPKNVIWRKCFFWVAKPPGLRDPGAPDSRRLLARKKHFVDQKDYKLNICWVRIVWKSHKHHIKYTEFIKFDHILYVILFMKNSLLWSNIIYKSYKHSLFWSNNISTSYKN